MKIGNSTLNIESKLKHLVARAAELEKHKHMQDAAAPANAAN
jgi:hypothetical protein